MECHRKNCPREMTEGDLGTLGKLILHFHDAAYPLLRDYMASEADTIKYHKLQHLPGMIRRLGHPMNFNGQFFEGAHTHVKTMYR